MVGHVHPLDRKISHPNSLQLQLTSSPGNESTPQPSSKQKATRRRKAFTHTTASPAVAEPGDHPLLEQMTTACDLSLSHNLFAMRPASAKKECDGMQQRQTRGTFLLPLVCIKEKRLHLLVASVETFAIMMESSPLNTF